MGTEGARGTNTPFCGKQENLTWDRLITAGAHPGGTCTLGRRRP
jgi:hypothetical protein